MSTPSPAKGRIFCSRIVCLFLMCFVLPSTTFAILTVKNAQQYRADTGAVIPPSGTIPAGAGLFLDCAPTDTTGAKVQMQVELQKLPARWTGNPNHVSSFVASGSRPGISVAAGLAAGNYGWRYRVVNSAGLMGVWVPANNPDFIVQAISAPPRATSTSFPATTKPTYTPTQPAYTPEPAAAPFISRVSPASLLTMDGNQPLTISGNNFKNRAKLSFVSPDGGTISSSSAKLNFVSANQINYQINNKNVAGTWTVQVNNPDGQSSPPVSFTVKTGTQPAPAPAISKTIPVTTKPVYTPAQPTYTPAPEVAPFISNVSPASLLPMDGNQPLTIRGNNFQNRATLSFVPPQGGTITSFAAKLTFVSDNQINYQINNVNAVGTWTVQVNNPDGQSSRPVSFTVTQGAKPVPSQPVPSPVATVPTPYISNVPPTPIPSGQPDLLSSCYTTRNLFWQNGFAPASTRPPNPHGYPPDNALGNCTWYAYGRMLELGYTEEQLTSFHGNAEEWPDPAKVAVAAVAGIKIYSDSIPAVGTIAQQNRVLNDVPIHHVAIVEGVSGDMVTISESSYYANEISKTGDYLWKTKSVEATVFDHYIHVSNDPTKTSSTQPTIGTPPRITPSTYSKQPQVSKAPSIINPQFPAGPNMNSRSSKPGRTPMMPGVSLVPDQAQ